MYSLSVFVWNTRWLPPQKIGPKKLFLRNYKLCMNKQGDTCSGEHLYMCQHSIQNNLLPLWIYMKPGCKKNYVQICLLNHMFL